MSMLSYRLTRELLCRHRARAWNRIDIAGNDLGVKGLRALGAGLATNPNLTYVNLSRKGLEMDCKVPLTELLDAICDEGHYKLELVTTDHVCCSNSCSTFDLLAVLKRVEPLPAKNSD